MANIIFSGEKLEVLPLKSEKNRDPSFTTSIQPSIGSSIWRN